MLSPNLPTATANPSPEAAPKVDVTGLNNFNVLILDDDTGILASARAMSRACGVSTIKSVPIPRDMSRAEALQNISATIAALEDTSKPLIILSDHEMGGDGGPALIKALKSILPEDTKYIGNSNQGSARGGLREEVEAEFKAAGVDLAIPKFSWDRAGLKTLLDHATAITSKAA